MSLMSFLSSLCGFMTSFIFYLAFRVWLIFQICLNLFIAVDTDVWVSESSLGVSAFSSPYKMEQNGVLEFFLYEYLGAVDTKQ